MLKVSVSSLLLYSSREVWADPTSPRFRSL